MDRQWLKEILLADQVGQIKLGLAGGDYEVAKLIEQVAGERKLTKAEAVEEINRQLAKVEEVVVESARDKPEEFWLDLAGKIKEKCGDKYVLRVEIRPDLVAGARIALNGKWFDGSVRTAFDNWWQKAGGKYV